MTAPSSLASRIRSAPAPFDEAAGARTLGALDAASFSPEARALIAGAAGSSPHLARMMARFAETLPALLAAAPEETIAAASRAALLAVAEESAPAQMKALREAKMKAGLVVALAEISGALTSLDAARLWSDFADAALRAATLMALHQLRLGGADGPLVEEDCGLIVLAMGKHGARELNYSSDIDLVILFDSASKALGAEPRRAAVASAKLIVSRLSDQTADGYVFRTDLRLRPDPGVSAAAVSLAGAETYYESYGQTWERAAFIKARPAAGDLAAGEAFLARIAPFIWRRYLDYPAVEEIDDIMRQLHAGKGSEAGLEGFDLKRGRGGIREIEFFIQTRQLIFGGKNPELRMGPSLDALDTLASAGIVAGSARDVLSANYRSLRRIEHRLQMIADEQTHRIPYGADFARLAAFLGEESGGAFRAKLQEALTSTRAISGALKGEPSAHSFDFSGVDHAPETIGRLVALGFARPHAVADSIRRWQAGEIRATRAARARRHLAQATPALLAALARAAAPDEAFAAFDRFIGRLPAGVQLFALFAARPEMFDRLLTIMTVSPWLAGMLAKRDRLVESLIEARAAEPLDEDSLRAGLRRRLARAGSYEAELNEVRRFVSEQNFNVGAALLTGQMDAETAGAAFAAIAEAAIGALLPIAMREAEAKYGAIAGEIVVVALGRLGARRMTMSSDLDLMFIYDAAEADSGGKRPVGTRLDATSYYARLVRRFLAAVASPTEEGALYKVDMQLRPSGGKGPAAVSFAAFRKYYDADAWTWEKMALTKARIVAGDAALAARVRAEVDAIIERGCDFDVTARDADKMRRTLRAQKPPAGLWDVKKQDGGSIDIDFILQYLTLTRGEDGRRSHTTVPAEIIADLAEAGSIDAADARALASACRLFERVTQMSRAATGGVFAAEEAGPALTRVMVEAAGETTFQAAERRLAKSYRAVRKIYDRKVGARASAESGAG